jgi:hypothetical protein
MDVGERAPIGRDGSGVSRRPRSPVTSKTHFTSEAARYDRYVSSFDLTPAMLDRYRERLARRRIDRVELSCVDARIGIRPRSLPRPSPRVGSGTRRFMSSSCGAGIRVVDPRSEIVGNW